MLIKDPVVHMKYSTAWTACQQQDKNLGFRLHLMSVDDRSKVKSIDELREVAKWKIRSLVFFQDKSL
jgi:hypothetical protein